MLRRACSQLLLRLNSAATPLHRAQPLSVSIRLNAGNQLVATSIAEGLDSKSPVESSSLTVLDECSEDVSGYAHHLAPTYNFAAYVDRSSVLQELVKLGVNLDKVERTKGAAEIVLQLDFDRDVRPLIKFLHDHGVHADQLGSFITNNPFIFKEDLDNLQIRVNYLEAKLFSPESISRIISKNPKWLSYSTKEIDHRLGFLQSLFSLAGQEVRVVTVRLPKLITHPLRKIEVTRFGVLEEMGFSVGESKALLLNKPKIYILKREDAVARFSYAHNKMGLPHSLILNQPEVLLYRIRRVKERHLFLTSLGRAQYDPTSPGYVSMKALLSASDTDFCTQVAKSSVFVFNKFLKTL